MSNVVKGNGKVHAANGSVTLCNRPVDGLTDTNSDVTCKVCESRKPAEPVVVVVQTVTVAGRMRHGMVKRARDLRRAERKALAAAL